MVEFHNIAELGLMEVALIFVHAQVVINFSQEIPKVVSVLLQSHFFKLLNMNGELREIIFDLIFCLLFFF